MQSLDSPVCYELDIILPRTEDLSVFKVSFLWDHFTTQILIQCQQKRNLSVTLNGGCHYSKSERSYLISYQQSQGEPKINSFSFFFSLFFIIIILVNDTAYNVYMYIIITIISLTYTLHGVHFM